MDPERPPHTDHADDRSLTLEGLELSSTEVELRKRWLNFSEADERIIKDELDPILNDRVDEIMDGMYEHFLAFEETRSFFPEENILTRAKKAQAQYFRRLTKGNYDIDYVRDRLRVGFMHHRIELEPKWYIGAYRHAVSMMLPLLVEKFAGDVKKQTESIDALLKIIFFDMGLAFKSYIAAKEFHIRKHRDVIRELETERRVTKSILEGAPIGIVTLSPELICLECNDEFKSFLDESKQEKMIGQHLFSLAPHLNSSIFENMLKSGQPNRRSGDTLNLRSESVIDVQYWDWAAWPVKDDSGKISGLVGMFSNVTDSVLLQQQREDFVATLTHDLKTPILATNRAVQFLLEGDFGAVSDGQREILETIHQSNSTLYSLVQTLLDVYRFDSGAKELNLKNVNIAALLTQVVTELMPLAQDKGIDLSASLSGNAREIRCDDNEIRRVVQNLIGNSLKFTGSGGSIRVEMMQTEEKTTIRISDTGKGISEENMPKLFQRFWQAGSTGRYYASTGLGLYLCRRIIEAHGGKIWAESTPGKGSTFSFEL